MGYNLSCQQAPFEIEVLEQMKKQKRIEKLKAREWRNGSVLFRVTRLIAEADSIGEGYSYCADYLEEDFKRRSEYRKLAEKIVKIVRRGKR